MKILAIFADLKGSVELFTHMNGREGNAMNRKRRHENGKRGLGLLASCGLRVFLMFTELVFLISAPLYAHEPPSQPQRQPEPSATSLLDSTTSNGRIGGYRYNGSLKPTPGTNSRFLNNAKYGNAGNIVGIEHNGSASRFQGESVDRFQSQMDFNILALRNEFQRSRTSSRAKSSTNINSFDSGAPRVVSAQTRERVPYAYSRRPPYGKYPEQLLAGRNSDAGTNSTSVQDSASMTPSKASERSATPQLLWMRGRTPQALLVPPNRQDDDYIVPDEIFAPPFWGMNDEVYNQFDYQDQALGGSLGTPSIQATDNVVTLPSAPSPEQVQKAFREYLEAQLLRSPDVNPLSPVQVTYQGGVATVRGVVPTPAARAAAGYILLSDPRVSKVNNLMTCAHDESINSDVSPHTPPQSNSTVSGQSQ